MWRASIGGNVRDKISVPPEDLPSARLNTARTLGSAKKASRAAASRLAWTKFVGTWALDKTMPGTKSVQGCLPLALRRK